MVIPSCHTFLCLSIYNIYYRSHEGRCNLYSSHKQWQWFFNLLTLEGERERDDTCCSTYLCINWIIPTTLVYWYDALTNWATQVAPEVARATIPVNFNTVLSNVVSSPNYLIHTLVKGGEKSVEGITWFQSNHMFSYIFCFWTSFFVCVCYMYVQYTYISVNYRKPICVEWQM